MVEVKFSKNKAGDRFIKVGQKKYQVKSDLTDKDIAAQLIKIVKLLLRRKRRSSKKAKAKTPIKKGDDITGITADFTQKLETYLKHNKKEASSGISP